MVDEFNTFALLSSLWQEHQLADWPVSGEFQEGELMTLDTVVAGCINYYCEENDLDDQRIEILEDCLNDLENLMPDLEPDSQVYFIRLKRLGELLLEISRTK